MSEVPLKKWSRVDPDRRVARLLKGSLRFVIDSETGMLVSSQLTQLIERQGVKFQSVVRYALQRVNYSVVPPESLFRLPDGVTKQVKQLSKWDEKKILKVLGESPRRN